jgi:hypothetical protein
LASEKCFPMSGIMTAKFVGDKELTRVYVLKLIQQAINDQQAHTGGIKETIYIGNRTKTGPPPSSSPSNAPVAAPVVSEAKDNSKIVAATLGGAATFLFLLGLLFLLYRKRRTSRAEKTIVVVPEVDTDLDLELANTASSPRLSPTVDQLVDTGTLEMDAADDDVEPVDVAQNSASLETDVVDNDSEHDLHRPYPVVANHSVISSCTTVLVSNIQKEADDTDLSCDDDAKGLALLTSSQTSSLPKEGKIVDELPPLPPQGPSKKLAQEAVVKPPIKRRRLRKKKGKRKEARASSRENIKSMETIAEAEGEYEHDNLSGDGSDSEYSWTTDESGSRSRDPSPARSDSPSETVPSPTRLSPTRAGSSSAERPTSPLRFV